MKSQTQHVKCTEVPAPRRNIVLAIYIAFISAFVITYSLVKAVTYL